MSVRVAPETVPGEVQTDEQQDQDCEDDAEHSYPARRVGGRTVSVVRFEGFRHPELIIG